jgi:outer membrane biosynthesis protein TonB
MRSFLFRLLLAAAFTLGVVALNSAAANAQEPSAQEPAATTPPQQQQPQAASQTPMSQDQQTPADSQEPTARPQQDPHEPAANSQQNEPQMPAAGTDAQTQDAKSFSGRIMKENGKIVLKDPVTKTSYQIDDASKVKPYMGKQVKVTGKLDMNSNTIHVDSIEPMS